MSDASIPTGRGWYPDPFKKGEVLRLFDGARWTDQTRPIPEGYDATQAGAPQKKETPKGAAKGPERDPAPSAAPALKTPDKKQGVQKPPPAKNGTAPMFTTPTAKAETDSKDGNEPGEGTPGPTETTKPAGAPAFATPTVKAEKPKSDAPNFAPPAQDAPTPEPTPTEKPAPAPAAGFTFAKAANGPAQEPARDAAPEPQAVAQPPQKEAPKNLGGMPEPDTSDYTPEEDSTTVNNAFAAAPSGAVDTEDWDEEEQTKGFKARLSLDGVRDLLGNARLVTWAVTLIVAIAAVVLPNVLPSPIRGVAAECEPITEVVVSYDQASDFTITPEAQAGLAGAVSTGKLDEELTNLVTTAVDEGDLEPIVEHCLPQEVE